ncbi:uncharacterized protein Z518_04611 [Rhinocladiella mackenziei CBS 650.93]|uniref:Rhinocladiella mackenziei CBS 650.93 unplaced genomic scaffold supercont1.3, whole genome shotgun sequence n=1 Tax=Rhinocladiella mackenziei CBS 650.93 TaxID=1442369 RepID=A0A0D2JC13_9EURO|nr:uncharacterized protein Z518_04611 [Rhinocladiella mackenziei CBS 650.93]KIX06635.1 hypothetical protein Z518_04611 [Rhinocladiella mackenziei CBS 650.93]
MVGQARLTNFTALLQFSLGQSNPTYLVEAADGRKDVLPKKPPGKIVSSTAHRVSREFRILRALEQTDVPTPKVYTLCEDDGVIGTHFYIMQYIEGRHIEEPHIPGVSPEERTEMYDHDHDAIRTLARLHRLDFSRLGLAGFGRHHGFYDRQIKTLKHVSDSQACVVDVHTKRAVGGLPHLDEMTRFFSDPSKQPRDRSCLVHGDFKIDNLIFHKTEPRVIGVLDWEMATIGHPLSDAIRATSSPTGGPMALPTQGQILKWYFEETGYDVSHDLTRGTAFAGFRCAVIMQGVSARLAQGQASGKNAIIYRSQISPYTEWALSPIHRLQQRAERVKL